VRTSPTLEQQFAQTARRLDARGRIRGVVWFLDGLVVFWANRTEHWGPTAVRTFARPESVLVDRTRFW